MDGALFASLTVRRGSLNEADCPIVLPATHSLSSCASALLPRSRQETVQADISDMKPHGKIEGV
jgi:hypothetical protein